MTALEDEMTQVKTQGRQVERSFEAIAEMLRALIIISPDLRRRLGVSVSGHGFAPAADVDPDSPLGKALKWLGSRPPEKPPGSPLGLGDIPGVGPPSGGISPGTSGPLDLTVRAAAGALTIGLNNLMNDVPQGEQRESGVNWNFTGGDYAAGLNLGNFQLQLTLTFSGQPQSQQEQEQQQEEEQAQQEEEQAQQDEEQAQQDEEQAQQEDNPSLGGMPAPDGGPGGPAGMPTPDGGPGGPTSMPTPDGSGGGPKGMPTPDGGPGGPAGIVAMGLKTVIAASIMQLLGITE